MQRRRFFSLLGSALALPWAGGSLRAAVRRKVLLQEVPLAGFQYHSAPRLWPQLAVGQALALVREPGNPHDGRAVAVHWAGERIGYLPRRENHVASGMLDRGERLCARIEQLREDWDPWSRVRLSVWLELG